MILDRALTVSLAMLSNSVPLLTSASFLAEASTYVSSLRQTEINKLKLVIGQSKEDMLWRPFVCQHKATPVQCEVGEI